MSTQEVINLLTDSNVQIRVERFYQGYETRHELEEFLKDRLGK